MTEVRPEIAGEVAAPYPEQLQGRIQGFLDDERLETVRLASNTPQQETDERVMQALESLGVESGEAEVERGKKSSFLREHEVRRTVHPLRRSRNPLSFAKLIKEVELDGGRARNVEWRIERQIQVPWSLTDYILQGVSRALKRR